MSCVYKAFSVFRKPFTHEMYTNICHLEVLNAMQ